MKSSSTRVAETYALVDIGMTAQEFRLLFDLVRVGRGARYLAEANDNQQDVQDLVRALYEIDLDLRRKMYDRIPHETIVLESR